jgi:hypothetical protein
MKRIPKMSHLKESFNVIPAKAGIQLHAFTFWIPASAWLPPE